jgi:peptide/nickel transport system substrate-binding protein
MSQMSGRIGGGRLSRGRFLRAAGVTAATGAAYALACGGSGGGSAGNQIPAVTDATGAIAKPGALIDDLKPRPFVTTPGKAGGTLMLHYAGLGANTEPAEMDPIASRDVYLGWMAGFISNGLVKWTESKEYGALEVQPDLAQSWETPDETTLTFKLRPNVRWHDVPPVNGRPFAASDVKVTLERQAAGGAKFPLAFLYSAIGAIETPDPTTVVMKLKSRDIMLATKLGHPQYVMNSPEVIERFDIQPPTLIGTGPFVMARYTKGSQFELKKNPTYFKEGRPYLDGITLLIVPDASAKLANLRSKTVDLDEIPFSQLQPFRRSNPEAVVIKFSGNVQGGFAVNQKAAPFTDIRVRKAVQLAIDPQDYINVIWDGQAQQNPGCWWWQKPYVIPQDQAFKQDLNRARQLLAEAGMPNGFRFSAIPTSPATGPGTAAQQLEIWQDQLKKINVQLDIEAMDVAQASQRIFVDKAFQAYSYQQAATHEDPDRFWMVFVYAKAGNQVPNYQDPRMNDYLEGQRAAKTVDERVDWYQKAQRLNVEDPGYIFLTTPYKYLAMQPYVRNWVPRASLGSVTRNSDEMWLDK